MGRTRTRRELVDTAIGQHLALAIAAHLARTQLVADPLNAYDAQHLRDSVEAVARALTRVAPLYVNGPADGQLRQLSEAELEGAKLKNGADTLMLRDGRTLSAVLIKRADLRQAIAILKAVGIPELTNSTVQQKKPSATQPRERMAALRAKLDEIEQLVRLPLIPAQVERANALAVEIARSAPHGRISNLAMHLMSAVHEARSGGDAQNVRLMLARLRSAVDDAATSSS